MSAGAADTAPDGAPDEALDEATALRVRRLELDLADLRAENARLKGSIAQRQDEILRLGERLAGLQKRLAPVRRAASWVPLGMRPGGPLRAGLRRLGAVLRRPG